MFVETIFIKMAKLRKRLNILVYVYFMFCTLFLSLNLLYILYFSKRNQHWYIAWQFDSKEHEGSMFSFNIFISGLVK